MSMFYGVSRLGAARKHAWILLEGLRAVLNKSSSIRTFLLNPLTVQFFAPEWITARLGFAVKPGSRIYRSSRRARLGGMPVDLRKCRAR
jgi:hypothetical protein